MEIMYCVVITASRLCYVRKSEGMSTLRSTTIFKTIFECRTVYNLQIYMTWYSKLEFKDPSSKQSSTFYSFRCQDEEPEQKGT